MKTILKITIVLALIFTACKSEKKENENKSTETKELKYASYGDEITDKEALTASQMFDKYKTLQIGDTINVKFASTIKEVCTAKGCWMKLPLDDNTETMVKFKDYGFFMPLDSKDSEVIVEGKAFVQETSVEELRHYAEDAGKSKEEIAKITTPKKEFSFEANGVLLK